MENLVQRLTDSPEYTNHIKNNLVRHIVIYFNICSFFLSPRMHQPLTF